MAKSGGQISAVHLTIAASGGVLLYAALTGMTPAEALKEMASGKTPKPVESKKTQWRGRSGTSQVSASGSGSSQALAQAAEKYLGVPYAWGGATSRGMDCSGLVVLAFKDAYGVNAPRTTYTQEVWKQLQKVGSSDLTAGDLVFWPGHVAIYVGNGRVIHAPRPGRSVMYAPLADAGPIGINPTSYQRYKHADDKAVSI